MSGTNPVKDEAKAQAPASAEAPKAESQAEAPKADAPKAEPRDGQKDWAGEMKKFAFAAMGLVPVSTDEVKGFVKRLVEKGEIARKDGERIVKQFADRVQKTVVGAGEKPAADAAAAKDADANPQATAQADARLTEKINASIERVLHGMNIATRKDVLDLTKQLDELDKKLGSLLGAAEAEVKREKPRKPAAAPAGVTAGA